VARKCLRLAKVVFANAGIEKIAGTADIEKIKLLRRCAYWGGGGGGKKKNSKKILRVLQKINIFLH
jgi:hypothetical protein